MIGQVNPRYFHGLSSNPTIEAAQLGDLNKLKLLVETNPRSLTESDEKGYSAFHWAAYNDEDDLMEFLLETDLESAMLLKTIDGMTCLHTACSHGSVRVVGMLLNKFKTTSTYGTVVNGATKFGETSLHLAVTANCLKLVLLLIDAGVDLNVLDKWKRTPLNVAVQNGYREIEAELRKVGAIEMEQSSDVGQLSEATINFNKALVSQLTSHVVTGEFETIKLMKTKTVEKHIFSSDERDVNPQSACSASSACFPTMRHATVAGRVALSKLVEFPGDPERLQELLKDEKIIHNGRDMFGYTALMKFASWNKTDLMELLLPYLTFEEVNATCTGKEQKGLPLLHLCVDFDAKRAIYFLLKCDKVDLGVRDAQGMTFREYAALNGKQSLLD